MTTLDFEDSMQWLESLYHRPHVPAQTAGLARVERLLAELGHPERTFRSVHIAGSSGKGSTTTMLGEILRAAGYRTGVFRSPHLQSPTERIAVAGEDISRDAWERCFNRVLPIAERMEAGTLRGYDLGRPTFFEMFFAIMAVHFRDTDVEWASVETGLGGRLDATNTLRSEVAVVTNVSLEHTRILGSTVEAIAREKAAIIKNGCSAVTAADHPDALRVLRTRADDVGVPLYEVGRDVEIAVRQECIDGQHLALTHSSLAVEAHLPVAGRFQAANAATAFLAGVALRERGVDLQADAIAAGLSSARPPGRMEVLRRSPLVVLDGAHNPAASSELAAALRRLLSGRPVVLLFAAMADKDVNAMAEALSQVATRVVTTRAPGTDRAADADRLAEAFRPHVPDTVAIGSPDEALGDALQCLTGDEVLVVCGSLYLVGHVRGALSRVEVRS
jgi:dihydrofolate synthase/folylpolyglutamate synthase